MFETFVEVLFNKPVARDTFFMGLRADSIASAARPGQFVMIRVRQGTDPLLRRPFSICGVKGDALLILFRVVGRGTEILSQKTPGDALQVLGPLGKGFDLPDGPFRPVLTAGGMGIAPLIFLSLQLERKDQIFLAGYGTSSEIVPPDQLSIVGFSSDMATEDGSQGFHGRVTELLKTQLSEIEDKSSMIFACGPLPMLKTLAAIAHHHHLPCQVSLESTMACGLGVCQGCAVKNTSSADNPFGLVCRDGPVFDAQTLDWEGV